VTRGLCETGEKTVEEVTSGVQDAEEVAVVKVSKFNVAQDVLGSDLLCKVMGFLGQDHVFVVIAVCHRWRQMAAGLEERLSDTGAINWPAFRHRGIIKQKKHSMVIKCQSRSTGKVLVVKRIRRRVCPNTGEPQDLDHPDQGFPVRYLREIGLLRAAHHPNVMQLYCISYYQDQLDVFSEFVGQNIEDHLAQRPPEAYLSGTPAHKQMMDECRGFVAQILEGIHIYVYMYVYMYMYMYTHKHTHTHTHTHTQTHTHTHTHMYNIGVSYLHSMGIILRDIKPRNVMIDLQDPSKVSFLI
jgi:serine/threonine protein kinase